MLLTEYDEKKHLKHTYNEGYESGQLDGVQKRLIELTCKKLSKGHSVAQIADMLEEELDTIQNIVETATKYAPNYDIQKILTDLRSKQ